MGRLTSANISKSMLTKESWTCATVPATEFSMGTTAAVVGSLKTSSSASANVLLYRIWFDWFWNNLAAESLKVPSGPNVKIAVLGSRRLEIAGEDKLQEAANVFPDRMHCVQTRVFLRFPPDWRTLTLWILGSHLRLLRLWAWLTRKPLPGVFPQIWHLRDISPRKIEIQNAIV